MVRLTGTISFLKSSHWYSRICLDITSNTLRTSLLTYLQLVTSTLEGENTNIYMKFSFDKDKFYSCQAPHKLFGVETKQSDESFPVKTESELNGLWICMPKY